MATGDITAAQVLALADFNSNTDHVDGWVLKLTIEGRGGETLTDLEFDMDQSGTYDNNLADIDNAAVVVSLTSEGYTGSTLGTTSRTVYGTRVLRKIDPNETELQLANASGDLEVYIALSDYVFSDDTSLTVAVAENFCRRGTGSVGLNNSVSSLSVTNSSAVPYSEVPPVAVWNIPHRYRYWNPSDGDFTVSVCATHQYPKNGEAVAAVVFTLTDGTNTAVKTITASSLSSEFASETTNGTRVVEYAATFSSSDVSSFTEGECEVRCQVYPHIGDAAAVLDSGTTRGSGPDGLTPFQLYLDDGTLNPPVYAYVTPGTTGASVGVSETRGDVVGDATKGYATIRAAATAIRSYNNTNYSINNESNGVIVVADESAFDPATDWGNGGVNPTGTQHAYMVVEPENADGVTITVGSGNAPSDFRVFAIKIDGINIGDLSSANRIVFYGRSGITDSLWLNDVTAVDCSDYNSMFFRGGANSYMTGCTLPEFDLVTTTGGTTFEIFRGSTLSKTTADVMPDCPAVIGNKITNATIGVGRAAAVDNALVGFNKVLAVNSTTSGVIGGDANYTKANVAVVQSVLESINSSSQKVFGFNADANTTTAKNIIIQHVTAVGERGNWMYNDVSGTTTKKENVSLHQCIFDTINIKGDAFVNNSANIGNQNAMYGVGHRGNVFINGSDSASFQFEYDGPESYNGQTVAATVAFTDDQSGSGNTGDGDYSIVTPAEAADTQFGTLKAFAWDLAGEVRGLNYAGAYGGGAVSGGAKHQRINLALGLGL